MRVLLVNPPDNSELSQALGLRTPPMGLMYIAAVLEREGIDVEILEANLRGMSYRRIGLEIEDKDPDVVGVTSTTPTIYNALRVVSAAKRVKQDVVTVIGGPHATFLPSETLLACQDLDVVVVGEGEQTMLELALVIEKAKRSGDRDQLYRDLSSVRGIAYRSGTKVRLTPLRPFCRDLDSIPFPARHLVPFEDYRVLDRKGCVGSVVTSRGCPFSCTYCVSSRMGGKRFRARSSRNVADEIELLVDSHGIQFLEFIDDIFTLDQRRASRLATDLRKRGLDIEWVASSRVHTISRRLLKDLSAAGLKTLYFGVESGSQRILDLMHKFVTLTQIRSAFDLCNKVGVDPFGSFMLGYPGETIGEMKRTVKFAKELKADYAQFSIVTPYPGTPLYAELKAKDLLSTEDWSEYTVINPVIKYEAYGYAAEVVKRMLLWAYYSFYLRPGYIVKHLHLLPSYVHALGSSLTRHFRSLNPFSPHMEPAV